MASRRRVHLLDVNVVLAIIDPAHQHHSLAFEWFRAESRAGFATCPLVQNGVLRIASNPAYPNRPGDVDDVRRALRRLCDQPGHRFWGDSLSLLDALPDPSGLVSGDVTDAYLALLASSMKGLLLTFDRRIPIDRLGLPSTVVRVLGLSGTD